ncbi:hypothetical protein [Zooshikella harenae]|uniref:Outer membrane lipoprotein carrier protein LolA n=1 Tax=Zooshikella harenae TaxID=2827238 RepID=A0ABS5ZG85_9GAMM|nr:hypothetical protein [Zooshikella harenae]MBU2713074.1 hypothetical protein [Zooshikella harenae]
MLKHLVLSSLLCWSMTGIAAQSVDVKEEKLPSVETLCKDRPTCNLVAKSIDWPKAEYEKSLSYEIGPFRINLPKNDIQRWVSTEKSQFVILDKKGLVFEIRENQNSMEIKQFFETAFQNKPDSKTLKDITKKEKAELFVFKMMLIEGSKLYMYEKGPMKAFEAISPNLSVVYITHDKLENAALAIDAKNLTREELHKIIASVESTL